MKPESALLLLSLGACTAAPETRPAKSPVTSPATTTSSRQASASAEPRPRTSAIPAPGLSPTSHALPIETAILHSGLRLQVQANTEALLTDLTLVLHHGYASLSKPLAQHLLAHLAAPHASFGAAERRLTGSWCAVRYRQVDLRRLLALIQQRLQVPRLPGAVPGPPASLESAALTALFETPAGAHALTRPPQQVDWRVARALLGTRSLSLIASGPVQLDELKQAAGASLGRLPAGAEATRLPLPSDLRELRLIHLPSDQPSALTLATRSPAPDDALDAGFEVLRAWLATELEQSLARRVRTRHLRYRGSPGLVLWSLQLEDQDLDALPARLLALVAKLRPRAPDAESVAAARLKANARQLLLATPGHAGWTLAEQAGLDLAPDQADERLAAITSVNQRQLAWLAERRLKPSRLALILSGGGPSASQSLQRLGPVRVLDPQTGVALRSLPATHARRPNESEP